MTKDFVRLIVLVVLFGLRMYLPACAAEPLNDKIPLSLSVSDCITQVLKMNPQIEAAKTRIAIAQSRLRQARSRGSLLIDSDLGFVTGDQPSAYLFKHIDARKLPPGTDFNNPGSFSALEFGITGQYTILDGGRKKHMVSASQNWVESAEQNRRITVNNLVGAVIQTYFSILGAEEFVTAAAKSLETLRAQLEEVRVRADAGSALKSDILAMEVRLAKGNERLVIARNNVEITKSAMRELLNLKAESTFTLSGKEWSPAELPDSYRTAILEARKNRPELQAAAEEIEALRDNADLARSNKNPNLNLIGRYSMTDNGGNLSMARDNWTVGAQVNWNIFDNGLNHNAQKEAEAMVEEAIARKNALERKIESETQKAFLSLTEALTRQKVAAINNQRAEEALDLMKKQYAGGIATITAYLQSEDDRTQALFRSVKSKYDVKKAKAALGNAIGFCVKFADGNN